MFAGVTESISVKFPATNKSPNDSTIPHRTSTGFLDFIVTFIVLVLLKLPITITVVFVAVSVYV